MNAQSTRDVGITTRCFGRDGNCNQYAANFPGLGLERAVNKREYSNFTSRIFWKNYLKPMSRDVASVLVSLVSKITGVVVAIVLGSD